MTDEDCAPQASALDVVGNTIYGTIASSEGTLLWTTWEEVRRAAETGEPLRMYYKKVRADEEQEP